MKQCLNVSIWCRKLLRVKCTRGAWGGRPCCRKAVKAALVLLPLLGANNILAITGPFTMTPVCYGLWSFASFTLTAFQGLLFSVLYCFSNSDVRSRITAVIINMFSISYLNYTHEALDVLHQKLGKLGINLLILYCK